MRDASGQERSPTGLGASMYQRLEKEHGGKWNTANNGNSDSPVTAALRSHYGAWSVVSYMAEAETYNIKQGWLVLPPIGASPGNAYIGTT